MTAAGGGAARAGASDHPAIVPTAFGPVGVIVSEPEGPPTAVLLLLQGGGAPCRSGVNRCWTRLARDLAARGVAVLRFDFAAEGDSTMVGEGVPREVGWRRNTDLAVMREVAAWLRRQLGVRELLVAGSCHGGRVALDFAAQDADVDGAFLVVPYLWNVPSKMRPDKQAARDTSLPRAAELYEHGSSDVETHRETVGEVEAVTDRSELEESIVESCRDALRGAPIWMLLGEGDSQKPAVVKERLGSDAERLELEIVPGMIIHPVTHPEVQELVATRLLERILATLPNSS